MTDNKSDQMRETSDCTFEVGISDIRKKKKTGLSATGANWYLCFQKDLKVGETANKVQERPTPSRANLKKWRSASLLGIPEEIQGRSQKGGNFGQVGNEDNDTDVN